MKSAQNLESIYEPIAEPLQSVREAVDALWREAVRIVPREAGVPPPRAGGKLLRPGLCLLAAGAAGAKDLSRMVKLATAFEALHIASLAHDDVLDHAALRRGNASLNARWDNHAAVLGGDYLVARAVEMMGEYNSCRVIVDAVRTVGTMAEGELSFFGRGPAETTEEDCLFLAERKTAILFAEAARAPAQLIEPKWRRALYHYGKALGVAFQIVDDILDLTQPAKQLGKPACGDVVEGKTTLPILFFRETLTPNECARLEGMRNKELTEAARKWITAGVTQTGAIRRATEVAQNKGNKALDALSPLPPSPFRDAMQNLVSFVLVRLS